jgi:AP-1-like transcription factor
MYIMYVDTRLLTTHILFFFQLEEKVAQLEAKNETTQAENENLRDLLNRLRQENIELKRNQQTTSQHPHTKFEFRMPRTGSSPMVSSSSSSGSSPGGTSSGSTPSSSTDSPDMASNKPDWSGLQTFDPNALSLLYETPQTTATDLQLDFPFGDAFDASPSASSSSGPMDTTHGSGNNGNDMPTLGKTPFTTIASNPNFMSFADFDVSSFGNGIASMGDVSLTNEFGGAFEWPPAPPMQDGSVGPSPYDDPFGHDFFGAHNMSSGPMDFAALTKSTPSAFGSSYGGGNGSNASSPVSHRQNSTDNGNNGSIVGSCPGGGECPTTRAEVRKCIEAEGQSVFAPSPSPAAGGSASASASPADSSPLSSMSSMSMAATPLSCTALPMPMVSPAEGGAQSLLKKGAAGILCHGSSIPKTEKSEKNVEVLSAWRTITSDPGFKVGFCFRLYHCFIFY